MDKLNLMNSKTVIKIANLAYQIDNLVPYKDKMTTSDYQAALDAIIINAMQFGFEQSQTKQ